VSQRPRDEADRDFEAELHEAGVECQDEHAALLLDASSEIFRLEGQRDAYWEALRWWQQAAIDRDESLHGLPWWGTESVAPMRASAKEEAGG
jgi:hypothetical protein